MISKSGLFRDVIYLEGNVEHDVRKEDFIEGWKSHGTVYRQSKEKFDLINQQIGLLVEGEGKETIRVPYTTRIWMAQKA